MNNCYIALFFTGLFCFYSPILTSNEADSVLAETQIEYFEKQGISNYKQSNYVEAMVNFRKALDIAEIERDSTVMAGLYTNIGVIHDIFGNYDEAIINYQKALLIYDIIKNPKGKESLLNNIGVVYEQMNMPKKALEYHINALVLKKKRGDKNSIAASFNNIAIIHENYFKDYDSAYYYYSKAQEYFSEAGNLDGVGLAKSNMGMIHLKKEEYALANILFNESYDLLINTESKSGVANLLYCKGKLSLIESNPKKALDFLFKALDIAEGIAEVRLQKDLFFDIFLAFKEQKKYERALYYHERYDSINNKLLDSEIIAQISKLEMNFELLQNEQQILLLKEQAQTKSIELVWIRRLILVLAILIFFGVIIAILSWRYVVLQKDKKLLLLQSQLFRSQTSPHFIFNSLMAIQTFLLENKTEEASKYLIDFAKLIRSIMQNTRNSFVPLDQEIENLKQYLSLEKLRFGDKFDVDFRVNVSYPEEVLIPPMIAQPFIENAILHGLIPSQKKGLLTVDIVENKNYLSIIIEDNGIGRSQSAMKKKSTGHISMAIEITQNRIKLIRKNYNKKIDFNIVDLADEQGRATGTRVLFKMNIG